MEEGINNSNTSSLEYPKEKIVAVSSYGIGNLPTEIYVTDLGNVYKSSLLLSKKEDVLSGLYEWETIKLDLRVLAEAQSNG